MAITFDTSISGTASNSYVTVAEFNAYVEKLVDSADIPTSSQTTLIQKLLIAATEQVDSLSYSGYVTVTEQNLEFPRVGIVDRRGYTIVDTLLPQELKDATCEMAIYLFQEEINHAQHDSWDDEVQSASIGGALTFSYGSGKKPKNMVPERVKFLLGRIGQAFLAHTNFVRRS